jgi:hypothetical protein
MHIYLQLCIPNHFLTKEMKVFRRSACYRQVWKCVANRLIGRFLNRDAVVAGLSEFH